tara:strand:+ start:5152 stop:6045 length:894 start_codon:yes stop_codon:yes gene_type:complete
MFNNEEINPKGFNLLGEQLAESGLESNFWQVLGAAAASVVGGVMQSNQASRANSQAEKNYKKQMEAAEEEADKINEYNQKEFDVKVLNREATASYNWETALQKYDYTVKIKDYEFEQENKAYEADQERVRGQKISNAFGVMQGVESEQRALEDVRIGNAFEQQDAMVAQLRSAGSAALGQAGKSTQRGINSTIAELGREIAVMDASLNSAITDTNMNLMSINAEYYFANRNLDATAMIKPEALPDIPEPIKPPDPIWLEPMEVDPMFIQPPNKQSVSAPIVSGLMNAGTGLLGLIKT